MHRPTLRPRAIATWRIALAAAAGLALAACGPGGQVRSFSVQPQLVCPGQTVAVSWSVKGRAGLRVERGPTDWEEGEVPPEGSRTAMPAASTTFTVTALDANPAAGPSSGTKKVQVAQAPAGDRAASAPCDAATRTCSGSFTLDTAGGPLRVASVSAATMVRGGVTKPAALRVAHAGWQQPVPAGGTVAAGVPADGVWTLAVDLAEGDPIDPPPQLRVHLDFGCN